MAFRRLGNRVQASNRPSDRARHLYVAKCLTVPARACRRARLADVQRLSAPLADRYRVSRELGRRRHGHGLPRARSQARRRRRHQVLHPDLGAALGGDPFLSEIRTTARLQHPHIPLLDSGDADGLLYYVMPLVTGETLRARLERERQLPIAGALPIAREVASALDYAHRQKNVIHRDIKPENILLHDGSALVADFGYALACIVHLLRSSVARFALIRLFSLSRPSLTASFVLQRWARWCSRGPDCSFYF